MEGEQVEFILLPKRFGGPAVLLRRGFDVAQDGADINRLAVVATMIFAEMLHENILSRMHERTCEVISLSPLNGERAGVRGLIHSDA